MDIKNKLIEHKDNAYELESLYRTNPDEFKQYFLSVWAQYPDSHVLAVWKERLYFNENEQTEKKSTAPEKEPLFTRNFIIMGLLAILAGVSTRIILHFVLLDVISPISLVFGVTPFIAAYFIFHQPPRKGILYSLIAAFLITGIYISVLPMPATDSISLAYLHLPFFLWFVIGLAFTGNAFRIGQARLAYLKFNGEFVILYAIMAISGAILTLITIVLFSIAGMDIEDFYLQNIIVFFAASLAIVSIYLVISKFNLAKPIAPYIAKIFGPLVLITLVVFLVTVFWMGRNPFLDRDFLLSFNAVLLIVLAVTIYSISESSSEDKKNVSDYINFALIVLALAIDSVVLSAILFRLSSYGITPNRIAVLGINLLIWANLIWIMLTYMRYLRNKGGLSLIQDAVTKYMPIYGIWAAVVVFLFPLIFPE